MAWICTLVHIIGHTLVPGLRLDTIWIQGSIGSCHNNAASQQTPTTSFISTKPSTASAIHHVNILLTSPTAWSTKDSNPQHLTCASFSAPIWSSLSKKTISLSTQRMTAPWTNLLTICRPMMLHSAKKEEPKVTSASTYFAMGNPSHSPNYHHPWPWWQTFAVLPYPLRMHPTPKRWKQRSNEWNH